jgi:hypothetical protein
MHHAVLQTSQRAGSNVDADCFPGTTGTIDDVLKDLDRVSAYDVFDGLDKLSLNVVAVSSLLASNTTGECC